MKIKLMIYKQKHITVDKRLKIHDIIYKKFISIEARDIAFIVQYETNRCR